MFSIPRTWKWVVPGFIAISLGFWGMRLMDSAKWRDVGAFMVALALLGGAIAATNWWRLVSDHNEELHRRRREADSITPVAIISENMKRMHPEAVRVLERFGVRTSWQVRVDANKGTRTWILENTDPNVHFGFIEFVLSRSGRSLYPKNRFSEGSKKWDPDGVVYDRDQYDAFELWLFARLMVTRSHGEFKPAEFIPPWTPQSIMEMMGLTGEQALYEPADVVKELSVEPGTNSKLANGQKTNGNRQAVDVPELKDEEIDAVRMENEKYAGMYSDGKVPS